MQKNNIYDGKQDNEVFKDDRGIIADVFFNVEINHVAYITSHPGSIRGNHYHQNSRQHILVTAGNLEYWYAPKDNLEDSSFVIAQVGDLVTSENGEVHALRILKGGCSFVAFTQGQRGGSDYESDTFRVSNIIK